MWRCLKKRLRLPPSFYPTNKAKTALRKAFSRYLHGDGIEIGALHQPLPLEESSVTRIRYVDKFRPSQLREHYPELDGYKIMPVDVVDDGETLTRFADASLDFIIANHFVEHLSNPLGTLGAWLSKLKPDGLIYLAVPDLRHTYDRDRPLTDLAHLISDYRMSPAARRERDRAHYFEYARLVDKKSPEETEAHVRKLLANDATIHYHTFIARSFLDMLHYAQDSLALPFEIVAQADTVSGSDEFLILLAKQQAARPVPDSCEKNIISS